MNMRSMLRCVFQIGFPACRWHWWWRRRGMADRCHRLTWKVIAPLLLFNLICFNILLYYVCTTIWSVAAALNQKNPVDALGNIDTIRGLIQMGKHGGFHTIQQETLERLFVVNHPIPKHLQHNTTGSSISFLGLDVSHSGEATYVYRRILQKPYFPFSHLVVDIGANDGLMSSNSLNFIQLGWDAVLVEPLPEQIELARKNTARYRDPYNDNKQSVQFAQVAIGKKDGFVDFVVTTDAVSMENHVLNTISAKGLRKGEQLVSVKCMTVRSFAKEYQIPKRFAVLSIDAEGIGDEILHQWMKLGYRPAYIIYESLHNLESAHETVRFMKNNGYKYLTIRGWNHIFEFV